MKKCLFVLVTLVLSASILSAQGQKSEIVVNSKIKNVTIFLKGAEVQRNGTVSIAQGLQQLLFENLPLDIDPNSIQVSGTGNFTILGVSNKINYGKPAESTEEVAELIKNQKKLGDNIKQQNAVLENFSAEETMLKANQSIGGEQTGVKIAELKEFADYYRNRLNDISTQKLAIGKKIEELNKELEKVNNQLRQLRASKPKPTLQVMVDISAPASAQINLTLSYLVYEAGWVPAYDLRSSDIGKPIELIYKAQVYQNTGENWANIKPVFSTSNPTLNINKPELSPLYLNFNNPHYEFSAQNSAVLAKGREKGVVMDEVQVANMADAVSEEAKHQSSFQYTTVQEGLVGIDYSVDIPYTVNSGDQAQMVELAKYSLPTTYEYFSVRKLEKDVFLLAKVTGWQKLNLLSGEINLFFEGKYVGKTHLNTRNTNDTLDIALGRDQNITVLRVRRTDFTQKQIIGSNVTKTSQWDFTVHNKKKQPITLTLEDQIPVSNNSEIKVEKIDISGAELNEKTGKLTWKFNLQASESKTVILKYSVKYPKDKNLNGEF